jgi:RNA-binding protein YlmH
MDDEKLYEILKDNKIFQNEELDAYVHALVDIKEGIEKIINIHISDILNNAQNKEIVKDKLGDIREEFRHIQYHIDDAKLTE